VIATIWAGGEVSAGLSRLDLTNRPTLPKSDYVIGFKMIAVFILESRRGNRPKNRPA